MKDKKEEPFLDPNFGLEDIQSIWPKIDFDDDKLFDLMSMEAIPFNSNYRRQVIFPDTFKEEANLYNFSLTDREELRETLMNNPEAGKHCKKEGVSFTGTGMYKLYISLNNQGNDGRVIYAYFPEFNRIYVMAIYSKSQDKDLTIDEYKKLVKYCKEVRATLNNQWRKR